MQEVVQRDAAVFHSLCFLYLDLVGKGKKEKTKTFVREAKTAAALV